MPRVRAAKKTAQVEAKPIHIELNNVQNEMPLDVPKERLVRKPKTNIQQPLNEENGPTMVNGEKEMASNISSENGRQQKLNSRTKRTATQRNKLQNDDDDTKSGAFEKENKINDSNTVKKNNIDPQQIATEAINGEVASTSGTQKRVAPKRGRAKKEVATATDTAVEQQASIDKSPKKKAKPEISVPIEEVKEEQQSEKETENNVGTSPKKTKKVAAKKIKTNPDNAGKNQTGRKRAAAKNVGESEVHNGEMENIKENKINDSNTVKKNNIDHQQIATEAINGEVASTSGTQKRVAPKRGRAKKEVATATDTAVEQQASIDKSPKKKAKPEISVPIEDVKEEQQSEKETENNVGTSPKITKKVAAKKIKTNPDNAGKKQTGRKRAAAKNVGESEVHNGGMENLKASENDHENPAIEVLVQSNPQKKTASKNVRSKKEGAKTNEEANEVKETLSRRLKKDEMSQADTESSSKNVPSKKNIGTTNEKPNQTEKKQASRKRIAVKVDAENVGGIHEDNEEASTSKPKKSKKTLLNPIETAYNKSDFDLSLSAADGNISDVSTNGVHQRAILKISSWNVAGLRSWLKKDGLKYIEYEEPDIFCMQEIKCTIDQMPEEAVRIPGYHPYWLCLPGGYAGVALYSKIMPINVDYGIGNEEFDEAGRLITAEYEKFYLVNVYVPNSGRKLVNLDARMRWEKLFQAYVKKLDAFKPVIITGDMNVSHQEIDLANPKTNTRSAGFTIEERNEMTNLLSLGFVDTYRHLYPDKRDAYTYWTYMANARHRNVGWRLDYFLVSERIVKRVVENAIRSQCMGSDHCPITLFINM